MNLTEKGKILLSLCKEYVTLCIIQSGTTTSPLQKAQNLIQKEAWPLQTKDSKDHHAEWNIHTKDSEMLSCKKVRPLQSLEIQSLIRDTNSPTDMNQS